MVRAGGSPAVGFHVSDGSRLTRGATAVIRSRSTLIFVRPIRWQLGCAQPEVTEVRDHDLPAGLVEALIAARVPKHLASNKTLPRQ